MMWYHLLVSGALLGVSWCTEDWTFPPGFKFGAASSSYQVEGAWNVSDKGESIWDRFTHTRPEKILNGDNGDVACDSYHLWQEDIDNIADLGLHYYRFSISWPRLLPTGFANKISEDGARYYNNLIDGLLEKGIEPMVSLYHWDLPQTLQDLGGWTNPLIADWFADYARVAYSLFGDRVKMWLTINEPMIVCDSAYNTAIIAPGILNSDHGAFLCNKHVLLAHAKAYRVYEEEFRAQYQGEISIANQLIWYEAWTEDDEDIAELAVQYIAGRYSHAIYSEEGGWPPAIEKIIDENSKKKGYATSLLPAFTQEEIELIKGTYDYYAMNYYTSRVVRAAREGEQLIAFPIGDIPDLNAVVGVRPEWPASDASPESSATFFYIYPEGIRRQLVWLKNNYGNLKFAITENGAPDVGGLNDQGRIDYYQKHLKQLLLAIKEDGINLTHFTAWTLMDNFEWTDGYRSKFGLYEVDFNDPLRTRTPRNSARFYANIIKNNALDVE
ncbi:myrosinase 1-like isoform X2 [Anticarsia gemmatalis]|uniref:myrosinase 1-like isoform X2 n=1 Tax=Anticarsia gemmatalis TaxID=129554 RepID=UPI003F75791C